jgi:hypothetical protein
MSLEAPPGHFVSEVEASQIDVDMSDPRIAERLPEISERLLEVLRQSRVEFKAEARLIPKA